MKNDECASTEYRYRVCGMDEWVSVYSIQCIVCSCSCTSGQKQQKKNDYKRIIMYIWFLNSKKYFGIFWVCLYVIEWILNTFKYVCIQYSVWWQNRDWPFCCCLWLIDLNCTVHCTYTDKQTLYTKYKIHITHTYVQRTMMRNEKNKLSVICIAYWHKPQKNDIFVPLAKMCTINTSSSCP